MAPGVTIPAGQLGTTLEVIRKGHDVFRKDGMLDYDSAGRFHASVALDQGANFGKNDVLKISFAPLNQSFSNVHEIFTATYKAHP